MTGEAGQIFEGHARRVNAVTFSPDGLQLVSGSGDPFRADDHTLRLWDVATGQETDQWRGHTDWVSGGRLQP